MKHKRFKQENDDRWVQPVMRGYLMACCDCGLVHRLNFRVVTNRKTNKKQVQFKAFRAPRYTARLRKNMK